VLAGRVDGIEFILRKVRAAEADVDDIGIMGTA
jgi:hypothetical protein